MAVLDIVRDWRDNLSILHEKTVRIRKVDAGMRRLLDDMVDTMRDAGGVGLAAPQVGSKLSALVIEYAEAEEDLEVEPTLYKVLNPEVVKTHGKVEGQEGCLSVPGFLADVNRAERITVKGLDADGKAIRIKAEGWLARIFQHEIDHLNGILIMERANRLYRVEEGEDGEPVITPIGGGHENGETVSQSGKSKTSDHLIDSN